MATSWTKRTQPSATTYTKRYSVGENRETQAGDIRVIQTGLLNRIIQGFAWTIRVEPSATPYTTRTKP